MLLVNSPLSVSIESAYLATRILRYRALLREMTWDSIIAKGGAHDSEESRRLARTLLSSIEASEGGKIQDLDRGVVEQYVDQLYSAVQARASSELGAPTASGEVLLNRLREPERRI